MGRAGTKTPGPSAVSEHRVVAGLVRRVDTDAMTSAMTERFRAEIPAYRRLPEHLVQTVITEIVRQNVETFVRTVVEARPPGDADMAPFRASARDRAAEGMPLEDLIHAYRLGARLLWREIAGAAAPEERSVLPMAADLVMGYIDAVSDAVTRSYLGQARDPVAEDERRLRELLDALAGAGPLGPEERELAERVGFAVRDRYRPFVAAIPGAPAREYGRLAARLRKAGALALTEAERVVGLLTAESATVRDGDGVIVAVGEPMPRLALGEALDDLRLLLDVSRADGHQREMSLDEFMPELLLARSPRLAAALHDRVLGRLEEYADKRSTQLLETLDALVACDLDRRRTAAQLHVHRNTLDYRVRRIEELADLDLSRPRDLMLVSLALRGRTLHGPRPAATPPG